MTQKQKKIVIVRDFSVKPYGRYTSEVAPGEEDTTGENFRKTILAPALKEYAKVHVDLTGYNRYGPSFIDEAFGGLISSKEFSPDEVYGKLTYQHDLLPSIVALIKDRIDTAASYYNEDNSAQQH